MAFLDRFRSTESLVTELAQQEVDIYCIEGHMPDDADTEEYENCTQMYIEANLTRDEIIGKLHETRRAVK